MDREPCPWRIVDDAGGGFAFGIAIGTLWNFGGGLRNAPKGQGLKQAIMRAKSKAPLMATSFATWATFYSIFDCTFAKIRQKEDPWNAIASGFCTGGLLAIRGGTRIALRNAVTGGIVLGMIEGLNIWIQRSLVPWMAKRDAENAGGIAVDRLEPPNDPNRPSGSRRALWTANQPTLGMATQQGFDLDQIYNNEKLSGSEGSWGGKGDDVFGKPSTQVDEEKKSWWKPW